LWESVLTFLRRNPVERLPCVFVIGLSTYRVPCRLYWYVAHSSSIFLLLTRSVRYQGRQHHDWYQGRFGLCRS
jgi:hypothetical protein